MRPYKKRNKCPASGKIQFSSEKDAEKVLILTQQKRGDRGAKRIYSCTHCCFFHLTNSETDEKFNNTVEDKKLKYFDRWLNIINDIKNDTLGTVQTDKRDKTRLIPRGTSMSVFTCDDRFHIEIPSRQSRMASPKQLPRTVSSRERGSIEKINGQS